MSRFPKVTETFILDEILGLRELGFEVEAFPLMLSKEPVQNAGVGSIQPHHEPFLSASVLKANLRWVFRRPWVYAKTGLEVALRTASNPAHFVRGLALLPKAAAYAQRMQELGVEHVHAHFATHPALAALVVQRLTGIPFSFTAHGSDLHRSQTALGWKLEEAAFGRTISDYNVQFVANKVGTAAASKLFVIRCGIDPDLYQPRTGDPDRFRILAVGALRKVKGHRHLIDACQALRKAGRSFLCEIVGEGPERENLERQIQGLELEDHVTLIGALPREQVLERMQQASVLVLPSVQDASGRREGIPVTLMEAMACELPVVASEISGIPELVIDETSGLLVPPGSGDHIAQALGRLQDDPRSAGRIGRAARDRVIERFHQDQTISEMADRFQSTPV